MFKKFFKRFSEKKKPSPPVYERNTKFFKGDTPVTFPEETMIENISVVKTDPVIKKDPSEYDEIVVLVNGEKISSYRIPEDGISVGRDPSRVGIIIAEPIISKLHCSFFRTGDSLKVKDHNSTNGVYFNGIKVREHVISDGSVISLGKKGTVRLLYNRIKGVK